KNYAQAQLIAGTGSKAPVRLTMNGKALLTITSLDSYAECAQSPGGPAALAHLHGDPVTVLGQTVPVGATAIPVTGADIGVPAVAPPRLGAPANAPAASIPAGAGPTSVASGQPVHHPARLRPPLPPTGGTGDGAARGLVADAAPRPAGGPSGWWAVMSGLGL